MSDKVASGKIENTNQNDTVDITNTYTPDGGEIVPETGSLSISKVIVRQHCSQPPSLLKNYQIKITLSPAHLAQPITATVCHTSDTAQPNDAGLQ